MKMELRKDLPPLPLAIARLPVDRRGYPVPWFASWHDGEPDFVVVDRGMMPTAVRFEVCWICGQVLDGSDSFLIGPMCAVNNLSAEPPSHSACAHWAAQACPFLTQPRRQRNSQALRGCDIESKGLMIERNPGVTLVWETDQWELVQVDNGALVDLGPPSSLAAYARGRTATKLEIRESFESGLPALEGAARQGGLPDYLEFRQAVEHGRRLLGI